MISILGQWLFWIDLFVLAAVIAGGVIGGWAWRNWFIPPYRRRLVLAFAVISAALSAGAGAAAAFL